MPKACSCEIWNNDKIRYRGPIREKSPIDDIVWARENGKSHLLLNHSYIDMVGWRLFFGRTALGIENSVYLRRGDESSARQKCRARLFAHHAGSHLLYSLINRIKNVETIAQFGGFSLWSAGIWFAVIGIKVFSCLFSAVARQGAVAETLQGDCNVSRWDSCSSSLLSTEFAVCFFFTTLFPLVTKRRKFQRGTLRWTRKYMQSNAYFGPDNPRAFLHRLQYNLRRDGFYLYITDYRQKCVGIFWASVPQKVGG